MSLPKHLQDQYIECQDEYDHLTEKLQYFLEERRIRNFSVEEKYTLDKQVKNLEKEREVVLRQLQELDEKTKSKQLYSTMLRLGYERQVELFVKLVEAQSLGAFLIHGSPEHGQRWLLNRLVTQYLPNNLTAENLQFSLRRKGRPIDINAIWRELKEKIMGKTRYIDCSEISKSEIPKIVEGVYQWLKTKDVLFVFHDINFIPKESLDQLICEFWKPFFNQAKQTSSLQSQYKLLMVLVDYEGTVGSFDELFTDIIDPIQPENPVKLPKINRFSQKEIARWLLEGYGELPVELTHKYEDTVQIILEESGQGIPEYVLKGIFERCGFDYHEEIKNLLTL